MSVSLYFLHINIDKNNDCVMNTSYLKKNDEIHQNFLNKAMFP